MSGHTALIVITFMIVGMVIGDMMRLTRIVDSAKSDAAKAGQILSTAIFTGGTVWALLTLWSTR